MKKILSLLFLIIPFLGISQARFTTGDVLSKTLEIRPIQVTAKTAPNIPVVQLKNANLTVDTLIKAIRIGMYSNVTLTGSTKVNSLKVTGLAGNSYYSKFVNVDYAGNLILDSLPDYLIFKGNYIINSELQDIDLPTPSQVNGYVYKIVLTNGVQSRTYYNDFDPIIFRNGDYIVSNGSIWVKMIDNGKLVDIETTVNSLLNSKLNTSGGSIENLTVNTELSLIGQKDGANNKSKITITNQGFGADSRLIFTQSNYLTGAGWQFGEDILNVHGSYFGFAGNSNPQANIDLGTSGTLKIGNLAGTGKVLTSDASGNATWSTSPLDAKQNTLTGTGFVKSTGGTISYDNSTYLTSSALSPYLTSSTASSTYATQTNLGLKANSSSPNFYGGMSDTGVASNTIGQGVYLYLSGDNVSGISNSVIQQGIGKLDFYGYNGSAWVNNLSINNSTGNVGIGTPSPAGKLDVVSTTSPSYPFPRMTTAEVNALTGMTVGAWVFDTTTNHPKYYNGSAWVQL